MKTPLWLRQRRLERKAKRGPYVTHGRTLGYLGSAREPFTWFTCNNGHTEMGHPWAAPDRDCSRCRWEEISKDAEPFTGWEVAGAADAFMASFDACGPGEGRAERLGRVMR